MLRQFMPGRLAAFMKPILAVLVFGPVFAFAKPVLTSSNPELQKLFDSPRMVGGVWRIEIPKGKYRLDAGASACALEIRNQENLEIIADSGAEIIGSDPARDFIRISNSRNIRIEGFCFDLDPLPFLQADILSADIQTNTIRVRIGDEFIRPDDPNFEKFKDNVSIFPEDESLSYISNPVRPRFESATHVEGDMWEIKLNKVEPRFENGRLLMYAWFNGWLSSISGSENVTLDGIRTYCVSGGNFYIVHNNGDITVRNCIIRPREGSGYLWAADGGNQGGYNSGTVTFENNDFLRINDDGFNMGTNFVTVMEKLSDGRLRLDYDHKESFKEGDIVEIWDWTKKEPTLRCSVISSEKDENSKVVLKLSQDPADIVPGMHDDDRERQRTNPYTRIINVTRSGKLVLRGNKVSSFRARGALIKCQNSLVENNTFYGMSMPSLLIGPEFYWEEGPGVSNLTVRGNKFINVRTTAISIASRNADSPAINNSKILIEGNEFHYDASAFSLEYQHREFAGNAVSINNACDVTIRGNKFFGFPDSKKTVIIGKDTKNVNVRENRFEKGVSKTP